MFHCTPHPGLGTVVVRQVQVDLATCRTAPATAPVKTTGGATVRRSKDGESIVFAGKVVLKIHENYKGFPAGLPGPIELEGMSPDRKWIFYVIDPQGSASLAADGLMLNAVSASGGHSFMVASGLQYADYRTWCGGSLVITAGDDRIATDGKRLLATGPPTWSPRVIVNQPNRSFGSVVCSLHGKSVVVQSQAQSIDGNFFHTHWALWRVGLSGKMSKLTNPPANHADESPHFSPDGKTLYFVRSKKGVGELDALRGGKVVGPLLSLGYSLGYFGHQDWPYSVTR